MSRRLALAVALVPALAHGQPPAEVTMDQAVALYHEHSARLAAARAGLAVTAADIVDADLYPNPTLGVTSANVAHGDTASAALQESLQLDIPILIGGQRGHRRRTAELRLDAARAQLDADEADGDREVRVRFVALQAAAQKVAVLAGAVEDARAVRAIVTGRAQAGAKSRYDVERIELEVASLTSRLADARADEEDAAGALAAAVLLPGWRPRPIGDFRPGGSESALALDPAHPGLAAARATEAETASEAGLAEAEAVPTPSLSLGGYATRSPAGVALTVGVSIPLPLFDRGQGAIARARARDRAAHLETAARSAELTTRLDRAARVLAVRRDGLAHFEADAMSRLPRLRAMAEDAYRSGQGGIVELLDALGAVTEARQRDVDLVQAVLDAEIETRAAARGK